MQCTSAAVFFLSMTIEYSDKVTRNGERVLTWESVTKLRRRAFDSDVIAQSGGQENTLLSTADIIISGGNRGGGKGQSINDLVVTPFGFRKIGDLKKGDIITAIDGGMQKVIHIYELGERKLFRLKFSDGTHVDCTSDHVWKIKKTNHTTKKRLLNKGGVEDDWRLWTMEMIMSHIDKCNDGTFFMKYPINLLIPLCSPVSFTKPFGNYYKPRTDPYIIGAILGDGCVTDCMLDHFNGVMFTSADDDIVEEFIKAGYDMSRKKKARPNNLAWDYLIKDDALINDITGLKLAGCDSKSKFIPDIFKYGSIETRWALVQGMMDTDGYIDSRGHCSYTTISPQLAEDMAFVLRSLGAYVTVSKKKAGYKKDGEFVQCNDAYELYIKMSDTSLLFRLPRKKGRSKKYNGGVSIPTKRIVGYEYIGTDICRCLKVSHPSALYLTRDFTVTHNSFTLLMEALKDVKNAGFNGLILRNERDDLTDIINKSYQFFPDYGEYRKAKDSMYWDFYAGGSLSFSFHAGSYNDFVIRFQGREYPYIGIDEITHITYPKFKYLLTTNRNSKGIRNRVIGTCNPDPDSWVAIFIDWWIGEDGLPIKERDGKLRYCFMAGEDVTDIIWGDTPEEVYDKARHLIDRVMKKGEDWNNYILSVAFVRAELDDNKKLMSNDPTYKARLAGQSDEQVARDLEGNWRFKSAGDDIIKWEHMESFFANSVQTGDGVRRCSCDVAFDGGDQLVMWLIVGNHFHDVFACRANSQQTVAIVKGKLAEWGVREENFTYDLNGVGQTFKGFFPKAVPFNNEGAVDEKFKYIYNRLKDQAAYTFAQGVINGEYSINPEILDRKFNGIGYKNMTLRDILMRERRCIRRDDSFLKAWKLIGKPVMRQMIGHSPDFVESMFYSRIFFIKKKTFRKPSGLGRFIRQPFKQF